MRRVVGAAVDDVPCISSNPALLYTSGIRVGRAQIASVINTIVRRMPVRPSR